MDDGDLRPLSGSDSWPIWTHEIPGRDRRERFPLVPPVHSVGPDPWGLPLYLPAYEGLWDADDPDRDPNP